MQIQENVSLKEKNWFRTGGNAKYYCEPDSKADLKEALDFARTKQVEVFLIGEGANILVSDSGFDGLVISTQALTKIEIPTHETGVSKISVEAGAKVQDVIDYCLDHNLTGLEDFSGIPGTMGGSAYINIHYFDKLLSDFVDSAVVINKISGDAEEVSKDWFEYGYDTSKLMQELHVLYSIVLKVTKSDDIATAYARGRRDEIVRQRNMKYPVKNTCGSFFRNFLEDEVGFETNGRRILNVAYYLDKIGVKGDLRVGSALVSYKHANMIETEDGATSSDIIQLAKKMQELVKAKYNIIPQPECRLIGFEQYPLLG